MPRIVVDTRVRMKRAITRIEGPYAEEGETGTVSELFQASTVSGEHQWYAKVRMDSDRTKTFRLTNIEPIDPSPSDHNRNARRARSLRSRT